MATFLCISCEFKGVDFLKACKDAGNKVFLVAAKDTEHEAWPREYLDDIFFMEEVEHGQWNMESFIAGLAYLLRTHPIDQLVAIDDFDVEEAAELREHFRIPGMGQTTARHFRDKLAMRIKAADANLKVPAFTALFNDNKINEFIKTVQPPYMIKPRFEAAAKGIKKINSKEELWPVINSLGEGRHNYLAEKFTPGTIFHVDSLSYDGKILFTSVSEYLSTPWDVAHGGGIFRSVISKYGSRDEKELAKFNADVLKSFGMQSSASHTEFIKSHQDGEFFFLETASRVGGANLAEMVNYGTSINLWKEWARLEAAAIKKEKYKLPKPKKEYAGIITSLSRFENPDYGHFNDPEIVWKNDKKFHIGLIVQSKKRERVIELLDKYAAIIQSHFHAALPND